MQAKSFAGPISTLTLAVVMASPGHAQNLTADAQVMKKVIVSADAIQPSTENVRTVDSAELEQHQARDLDDVVRYVPGVSVDNIGRFGSTGFNIRGMDGDRVAITIDGLSLGEILNPASNMVYEFFSSGRGGIDIDAMKAVSIVKGADSISAGSGALGGAVMFVTKDPSDYLSATGNDTHLGIKLGYASANEEALATTTIANRTGALETMLIYTARRGHETDSFYSGDRPRIPGTAREIPDPVDYDNDNALFKLHYHLTDRHRLGLIAEKYDSRVELDNQTRLNASYLSRTTEDEIERDRYGVNYLWKAGLPLFDELEWRYDYQESYTLGHTDLIVPSGCPAGISSPVLSPCNRSEHRDYEQDLHKTVLHLDKALGAHQLSYGAQAEKKSVAYSDTKTRYVGLSNEIGVGWPQYGGDFVPDTDVKAYSLYVRDRLGLLNDRLSLNIGARYDRYRYSPSFGPQYIDQSGTVDDVDFSALTWQLGGSWNLAPHHVIWAQAGSGFRAPTVENMYFSPSTSIATQVGTGQPVDLWNTVANPDLEAEESLNIEVGYRWQGPRHQIGISAYRNQYDKFIDYTTRIRNADVEYQTCNSAGTVCENFFGDEYEMLDNVDDVTVKGVEVDASWMFADQWNLRFAYAWSEGESKDGTPLQSIVPASAVLGLTYEAVSGRWGAEASVTHSEGKDAKDAQPVDERNFTQIPEDYFKGDNSYTVVDLQARFNITDTVKLNLGVYNLFDEEYIRWERIRFVNQGNAAGGARGGVSEDGIHRYTEPGRNYRLTVAYRF